MKKPFLQRQPDPDAVLPVRRLAERGVPRRAEVVEQLERAVAVFQRPVEEPRAAERRDVELVPAAQRRRAADREALEERRRTADVAALEVEPERPAAACSACSRRRPTAGCRGSRSRASGCRIADGVVGADRVAEPLAPAAPPCGYCAPKVNACAAWSMRDRVLHLERLEAGAERHLDVGNRQDRDRRGEDLARVGRCRAPAGASASAVSVSGWNDGWK